MCWASREWALWPIFMLEPEGWRNQVLPVNRLLLEVVCLSDCKLYFPAVLCIVNELNLAGDNRRNCCDWN